MVNLNSFWGGKISVAEKWRVQSQISLCNQWRTPWSMQQSLNNHKQLNTSQQVQILNSLGAPLNSKRIHDRQKWAQQQTQPMGFSAIRVVCFRQALENAYTTSSSFLPQTAGKGLVSRSFFYLMVFELTFLKNHWASHKFPGLSLTRWGIWAPQSALHRAETCSLPCWVFPYCTRSTTTEAGVLAFVHTCKHPAYDLVGREVFCERIKASLNPFSQRKRLNLSLPNHTQEGHKEKLLFRVIC